MLEGSRERVRSRLLIADDHQFIVEGVCKIVAPEFDVVGTATNGSSLISEAARLAPDIIVLDLGMPKMNGIEATRQIIRQRPTSRIVVLTQQLSSHHVQTAFRAGAKAYVLKQAAATELIEALQAVLQGRYYLSSSVSEAA